MTKFITRKVPYTNIVYLTMQEDGQMQEGTETIEGVALDRNKAHRYLVKNGITDNNVIVTNVKVIEVLMKCPIDKFIANSTVVE